MRALLVGGSRLGAAALAALAVAGVHVAPALSFAPNPGPRRARVKPSRSYHSGGSIADRPHNHEPEIARRLRQQARNAERQRARQVAKNGADSPFPGISRRGRFVSWPDGSSAKAR